MTEWQKDLARGQEIEGKSPARVWHRFKREKGILMMKQRSTGNWVVGTQDTLKRQKMIRCVSN